MKDYIVSSLYDNIIVRYSDFSGMMRRGAFWRFMLVLCFLHALLYAVTGALSLVDGLYLYATGLAFTIAIISLSGLTVPVLSAMARRLNDTNNGSWFLLLLLVPVVGTFILLIFLMLEIRSRRPEEQTESGNAGKVIVLVILTVLFSIIGTVSFTKSTDKEFEALYTMSPGVLMTMTEKTLNGADSPVKDQSVSPWDAKQAMEQFHLLLQEERYEDAYRLMSLRRREEYGTFEQWSKSAVPYHEKAVVWAEFKYVEVDEVDEKPRMYFDVYYDGCEYPYRVMIVMVYENESWRVDALYPFDEE